MIIDAHLHCTGRETTDDVLRTLDEAGVDVGVLLAPFLGDGYSLDDAASLRRGNAHLSRLVRGHPDRLIGLAVVDPRSPDAPADLRHAVEHLGLRGAKMVPTGWYPYEARVQPVFAVADELSLPLLFHSGIFIDGRSGRFCRPTYFEALRDHPRTRVTLAHMGWPWTDEALAVALIDRIHGVPHAQAQFRLDISFGPPAPYRLEVLSRMLAVLGAGALQFGSDCFLPCSGAHMRERLDWVRDLMDQLALEEDDRRQIWSGTAAAWLGGLDAVEPVPALRSFGVTAPAGSPQVSELAGSADSVASWSAGVDGAIASAVSLASTAAAAAAPEDLDAGQRRWRPICC